MIKYVSFLLIVFILLSWRSTVKAATYAYDLDQNGATDTNLTLGICGSNASSTCLKIDSSLTNKTEVKLSDTPNACDPKGAMTVSQKIKPIGDFAGDKISEVSVVFCKNPTPALAVVNVSAGTVTGLATAPTGQITPYIDFARDPSGKFHPFLLQGGYNDYAFLGPGPIWGHVCIFRPDLTFSPECGTGFVKANVLPNTTLWLTRQIGTFTQDLDGDGWEDINVLYRFITVAVSPKTLKIINQIEFNIALATEPNSPPTFHLGRQFGIHAAVTAKNGKLRDVMIGGAAVNAFTSAMCNVSRFVGVLESD
ncbi:hypothetical protein MUP56_01270, partial [Patescibacteria group bacterium]|nr:hypothetical protein [Patescibacteria group bacterium]